MIKELSKVKVTANGNTVTETSDSFAFRVYQTHLYDKFKRVIGNREINQKHLGELIHAMKIEDYKVPILVDSNFKVIDGQHRLEARRKLLLPVYYYIIDGIATADAIITSSKANLRFNPKTIIELYCENGNEDYIKLRDFIDTYKVSVPTAVGLTMFKTVHSSGAHTSLDSSFSKGTYRAKYLKEASDFMDYIEECYKATKGNKIVKSASFFRALNEVSGIKGFSPDLFIMALEKSYDMIKPCASIKQYRDLINDVYNKSIKKNLRVNLKAIL